MIIWIITGFALFLAVIFAFRAFLGYRVIERDAAADYRYKAANDMVSIDVTQDHYVKAYRRLHGPRGSAYIAISLLATTVLTLPLLGLLSFLFEYAWRLGGQDRAFEPGYLVWQFMIFGGMIVGWSLIAYFFARRYYKSAPISFEDELNCQF